MRSRRPSFRATISGLLARVGEAAQPGHHARSGRPVPERGRAGDSVADLRGAVRLRRRAAEAAYALRAPPCRPGAGRRRPHPAPRRGVRPRSPRRRRPHPLQHRDQARPREPRLAGSRALRPGRRRGGARGRDGAPRDRAVVRLAHPQGGRSHRARARPLVPDERGPFRHHAEGRRRPLPLDRRARYRPLRRFRDGSRQGCRLPGLVALLPRPDRGAPQRGRRSSGLPSSRGPSTRRRTWPGSSIGASTASSPTIPIAPARSWRRRACRFPRLLRCDKSWQRRQGQPR